MARYVPEATSMATAISAMAEKRGTVAARQEAFSRGSACRKAAGTTRRRQARPPIHAETARRCATSAATEATRGDVVAACPQNAGVTTNPHARKAPARPTRRQCYDPKAVVDTQRIWTTAMATNERARTRVRAKRNRRTT